MNKTLVFNDVEMGKKEFYDSKKAIPLNLVDIVQNMLVIKSKIIVKQVNICWLFKWY